MEAAVRQLHSLISQHGHEDRRRAEATRTMFTDPAAAEAAPRTSTACRPPIRVGFHRKQIALRPERGVSVLTRGLDANLRLQG